MNPKRIQLLFFLGVVAISLHFAILLGSELFGYFSLSERTAAKISQWEIVPLKNKFALKASYTFGFKEKIWQGSSVLNAPHHLNEMAALADLKKKAKEPWQVYFKSHNPNISSLERTFPLGLLVRFSCSLCVLIYFFVLNKRYKNLLNLN